MPIDPTGDRLREPQGPDTPTASPTHHRPEPPKRDDEEKDEEKVDEEEEPEALPGR